EVRRRSARDQRVAGGLQIVVRGVAQRILRPHVGEAAPVEDRLVEAGAVAARGDVVVVGLAGDVAAVERRAAVDLRQQLRARLHRAFLLREAAGFGGGELGIACACELVRLQQVFGGRRGRQQDCQGEREGEG